MLTFEEKREIIRTFPELEEVNVSLGRINYHFEGSLRDKKTVIYHLHPNGNGYVFAGHLPKKKKDKRGFVNIREYSEEELRSIITDSINYLSQAPKAAPQEEEAIPDGHKEQWKNRYNDSLLLVREDELFNIYAGQNLEEAFESYKAAEVYLLKEGFRLKS